MHFRQHVPGSCDGVEPYSFYFETTEDLLEHPRVAEYQQDNYTGHGAFHRYSRSRHGDETLLMAEYDGGKHWWVVGYIDGEPGVDLPAFVPVKE